MRRNETHSVSRRTIETLLLGWWMRCSQPAHGCQCCGGVGCRLWSGDMLGESVGVGERSIGSLTFPGGVEE